MSTATVKEQRCWSSHTELICRRRGIKPSTAVGNREALAKLLDDMDGSEMLGLLAELELAESISGCSRDDALTHALGIDAAGRRRIAATLKPVEKSASQSGSRR